MSLDEKRMIWVDLENFGLGVQKDLLLEVGFKITNLELETIDERSVLIWDSPVHDERYDQVRNDEADAWVLKTHTDNMLFMEAREVGLSFSDAQEDLLDWLNSHGVKKTEPMCGSSVQFDRERLAFWMPSVHDLFSYRNIDVSTLKEIATGYNPSVVESRPAPLAYHRVIPDLTDTVSEFRHYLNNWLLEK